MMAEQPFLPLFFNNEDKELWEHLQKLSPEKRVETTKQALREFFQAHPGLTLPELNPFKLTESLESGVMEGDKATALGKDTQDDEDGSLDVVHEKELSLESLFVASKTEVRPDPLQNLFTIIGKEEDEEVVKFFSEIQTPIKMEIAQGEGLPQEKEIPEKEIPLKEVVVAGGGLSYLLQTVIGEEKDEDVIRFFSRTAMPKEVQSR